MHCPYCQQSVSEDSAQCAACGLDLQRLDRVLGIPPVLSAGLTDLDGVLSTADTRRVGRALLQFRRRFPQIQMALLIGKAPQAVPLRTWMWWLFNRSRFSLALDKGFVNRDILFALDTTRKQAGLTIGYGLEPFVGKRDLSDVLQAGGMALDAGEWGGACHEILIALDQGLRQTISRMPLTYGVPLPLLSCSEDWVETGPAW